MPTSNPAITTVTPDIAKHPTITSKGARGFLEWMKSDPLMRKVYERIKPQLAASLNAPLAGFGDITDDFAIPSTDISSVSPTVDFSDNVTDAAPTGSSSGGWLNMISGLITAAGQAVMTANQISTAGKVTSIQLQRAQAGQAPLNLNSYGLSTTPGVSLGLSANTRNLLLYLGLGIGGVWLASSLFKHRR